MNVRDVASAFVAGQFLLLRHKGLVQFFKDQTSAVTKYLLAYLEQRDHTTHMEERRRVLAYIQHMDEVMFMVDDFHLFLTGMGEIETDAETRAVKMCEINNRGQWLLKYLPQIWDAGHVFTRFDMTIGQHLVYVEEHKVHCLQAITDSVVSMLRAPFSLFKLVEPQESECMTSMLLAGIMARTLSEFSAGADDDVMISLCAVGELSEVQKDHQGPLNTSVRALILAYHQALETDPLGESEEAVRLVDEIDTQLQKLERDYLAVLQKYTDAFDKAKADEENTVEKFTDAIDRLKQMITKRLH